ncbi:three-helix bundle dimerization domain-containing protein [Geodermatophilus marinus]|uniref:three-helix bundle dimerization domain-containing protein n=1 Tax=Geodermatophilus sp. LHW52908 TaxID=2303986 RepID=UPI000E3C3C57|nr:hypothetical protein [Geodermatophilus sp. LHW52908]RFU20310.1 hypothetical protein D0Z06_16725 [Geodermatophilus sp. LHW52908]
MTACTPEPGPGDPQAWRVLDDLVRDHADRFSRDEVVAVYRDSHDRLAASARVTTFRPVPAGRFARERLDARVRDLIASLLPGLPPAGAALPSGTR